VKRFQAADNIMPTSYFQDVLPALAERPPRPDVELFWTVKTNLRRAQIRQRPACSPRSTAPAPASASPTGGTARWR
jgi:hypothetical protein